MDPTKVAYLAGLIDGEGTLSITKMMGKYYLCRLRIVNTNRHLLEWIRNLLGTGRIEINKRDYPEKKKMRWEYCVTKRCDLLRILKEVENHLISKREHVTVLIKFLELDKHSNLKEQLFSQLMELNKKGVKNGKAKTTLANA